MQINTYMNFCYLQGDKNLTGVTHVIVDEVHERSLLVSEPNYNSSLEYSMFPVINFICFTSFLFHI